MLNDNNNSFYYKEYPCNQSWKEIFDKLEEGDEENIVKKYGIVGFQYYDEILKKKYEEETRIYQNKCNTIMKGELQQKAINIKQKISGLQKQISELEYELRSINKNLEKKDEEAHIMAEKEAIDNVKKYFLSQEPKLEEVFNKGILKNTYKII